MTRVTIKDMFWSLLITVVIIMTFIISEYKIYPQESLFSDGEALASAYLSHVNTFYVGDIKTVRMTNNTPTSVTMRFYMDYTLSITNLEINRCDIPLRWPLFGLPIPTDGLWDFELSLIGVDKVGAEASRGKCFIKRLLPGSPIIVTIVPKLSPIFIPCPGVDPNNTQFAIENGVNWSGRFNEGRGGFEVYILDDTTLFKYQISSFDGTIIRKGDGYVYKNAPDPQEAVVNITIAGNVVPVRLGDIYYKYYPRVSFDGSVMRGETNCSAKVFAIEDLRNKQLYVWLSGMREMKAELRNKDGVLIPTYFKDYGSGYEIISLAKLESVIMTLIPTNRSPGPSWTSVSISRYPFE